MAMDSTQLAQNIGVRTASLYPSPKQHCDHISETSVGSKVRSVAPTRPSTKLNTMTLALYSTPRDPSSIHFPSPTLRKRRPHANWTYDKKRDVRQKNVMICQNYCEKRMEPDTFHTLASGKPVVCPRWHSRPLFSVRECGFGNTKAISLPNCCGQSSLG